jgi:hypothetical protein
MLYLLRCRAGQEAVMRLPAWKIGRNARQAMTPSIGSKANKKANHKPTPAQKNIVWIEPQNDSIQQLMRAGKRFCSPAITCRVSLEPGLRKGSQRLGKEWPDHHFGLASQTPPGQLWLVVLRE